MGHLTGPSTTLRLRYEYIKELFSVNDSVALCRIECALESQQKQPPSASLNFDCNALVALWVVEVF